MDHPELSARVRQLETDKSHTVYKAGAVGGIIGFILSVITQFWPQICAVLHFCVAGAK
jgi:hypothetical protein